MVKCCAPLCGNASYRKLPDITFHRFPKDVNLKNAWLAKISRKNWQPKPSSVFGSNHFEAHLVDFVLYWLLVQFQQFLTYLFKKRNTKDIIHLSKTLSWLLRHGSVKEGLRISSDGYVAVADILEHRSLRGKYNRNDIEHVVAINDKQRFKLRKNPNTQVLEIKANQGHTLEVSETELIPITEPKYSTIIHGTVFHNWKSIKTQGISRMQRQHIHLAKGLPNDSNVISGVRKNAEVFIYVNLKQALDDGLKFYESENGVILTPGNDKGFLEPKYFVKALNVSTGM